MTQRLFVGLLTLTGVVCAQHHVDPRNTYHRVIAVVPLIGSGTAADPKRPEYAPWGAPTAQSSTSSGIIGFTQVPTDDGKSAIVEFVARDRKSLAAILANTSITSFEKGIQSQATIETALQKVKKNFVLVQFEVVMP
jgi:hypothetical protein